MEKNGPFSMKLDRDAPLHAVKLRPTLILALGPWGRQVLEAFQQQLLGHFPGGLELPIWKCLWLDDGAPLLPLPGIQRIGLEWSDLEEVLRQCQRPEWQHASRWWYPGWSSLAHLAGDTRPAGRLRFFWHFASLRSSIGEAMTALRDPENPQRLLDSAAFRQRHMLAQVLLDQPTRIHLIASSQENIAGMLIDLGFWLREAGIALGVERHLWLAVDSTADHKGRARTYATLKELQHFCGEQHGFVAEWEPQREVRPLVPAYDQRILWHSPSPEQVALGLLQELWMPDIVEQLRSQRRSQQTPAGVSATRPWARPAQLPHGALRARGARRLARASMESLLSSTPVDRSGFELLGEERGGRRSWILRLLDPAGRAMPRDHSGGTLVDEILRWGKDSRRSLQRPLSEVVSLLQRILPQGRRWVEEELIPQLALNREALLEQELQRLRGACHQAVEQGGWGVEQVLERLQSLRQDLERWGDHFRRHAAALIDVQREISGRVARQLADLSRLHLRPNWDGRRSIMFRHFQDLLLEMHQGSLDRPGLFVAMLLQAAHAEAATLCRELLRRLELGESGQLAQEFTLLADQLRHQIDQLAEQPGSDFDFGEILLPEIFARYAADPAPVARELLATLGGGLQGCLQPAFQNLLLQRSASCFLHLESDYSWFGLYPRFKQELHRRLLADVPPQASLRCLILPAPPAGWGPLESSQVEAARRGLLSDLQANTSASWQVLETGFSEQIVAYSEVTAPLDQLIEVEPFRSAYFQFYGQGEPLHIEARWSQDWPEVGRLSPQQRADRDEAREAWVLGVLTQVLEGLEGGWMWVETEGLQEHVHPLGERRQLMTRLSRAPGLRGRLLQVARRRLEEVLDAEELSSLLALARRIAVLKAECWSAPGREAELELLAQLEQRIQSGECYRHHRESFCELLEAVS